MVGTNSNSIQNVAELENQSVEAVSYGIASTKMDQYYVENSHDFKQPKYVKKLPKRKQIRGKLTSIDEVLHYNIYL